MLRKSSIAEFKKLKKKVTIAKNVTNLKEAPEVSLLSQRREAEVSCNLRQKKNVKNTTWIYKGLLDGAGLRFYFTLIFWKKEIKYI